MAKKIADKRQIILRKVKECIVLVLLICVNNVKMIIKNVQM